MDGQIYEWLVLKNCGITYEFVTKLCTLKLILYVPNIGQFWQYIVCTAELA